MTAANDNAPAPVARTRARLVPLIGCINVDTGEFQRFDVIELIPAPPPRGLGEVVHFPSDPREA